jgi:hypothetical protein
MKGFIKDKMDERWDWWLLGPRLHPIRQGYCRLQWKSPIGIHHHIDSPTMKMEPLQAALSLVPVFLYPTPPESMAQNYVNAPPTYSGYSHRFSLRFGTIFSVWKSSNLTSSSAGSDSNSKGTHDTSAPALTVGNTSLAHADMQVTLRPPHLSQRPGTT